MRAQLNPRRSGCLRPTLLSLALLLAFSGNSNAQNTSLTITGPTLVCVGQCATYTVSGFISGNPSVLSYAWSNGSTASSLYLCFDQPGAEQYSITVTGFNPSNQAIFSETATIQIQILDYFPLEILSDNPAYCNDDSLASSDQLCEKVCPYSTVTYFIDNNSSPGGIGNPLSWSVSGASSYTLGTQSKSVEVTWGGPGPGNISIMTAGTAGCGGEDHHCVTIVEEPEAKFTAAPVPPPSGPLQVCRGQTVYFENQSLHAEQYDWYFGDDQSSSTQTSPTHIFNSPGTHSVTLVARSACFCADTTELTVEVLDALSPTLDCVGTVCPGATVTYTQDGLCDGLQWTVSPNGTVQAGGSPGSDSITVQWNAGPVGIITLQAQSCPGNVCPFPAVLRVPVVDDNAEIRGPGQVCPADRAVYSIEPYGGSGFVWALSGGGQLVEGQGTPGVVIEWNDQPNPNAVYWLTVEYANCYLGCGGRDSLPVRVVSPFVITGPVEQCENSAANFTARLTSNLQSVPADWTLYGPNGLVVWTSAVAVATVTAPFTQGPGYYRLEALPANPAQTCTERAEWAVRVAPRPAPPTGIDGPVLICPGQPVTYEALGLGPSANVRWEYQNGPGLPATANGNPLNLSWGASPPYWIAASQVSADGLGCRSDTVLLPVAAIAPPTISGTAAVCEDATGTYSLSPVYGLDVQWSVQPAQAGTVVQGQGTEGAEVFWYQPGNQVLRATVCGQQTDFPVTVLARPVPVVQAPAGVCAGQSALAQTTLPFSAYSWKEASGTAIGAGPSVSLGAGYYTLEVTDAAGCTGAVNFDVLTHPGPNVSVTTTDPTFSCPVPAPVFLQTLTNQDGNFTYSWFLNGLPVGASGPTYTATQYGAYTVQATNAFGCTATAGPILLQQDCIGGGGSVPAPGVACPTGSVSINILPTGQCDSIRFQLVGNAMYVPGSADWTFFLSGGATLGTASGDNTAFEFPNAGKYLILVTADLTDGSTCFFLDSVAIEAVAAFTADPACPGNASAFQDGSTFLPGGGIGGWQWDFGDPASGGANASALTDPQHSFAVAGPYTVRLTVTALSGCTSVATATFGVPALPAVNFSLPVAACPGQASAFSATPPPGVTVLDWDFGDPASGGANGATGGSVYHTYAGPGTYTVGLQATNAYGCTGSASQVLTIAASTLGGAISPANPAPLCAGQTLLLQAPPGATAYVWSDGTAANQLTVTTEATYSVTLTDANGCTFVPLPVVVDVIPAPEGVIKAVLTNELGQVIGLEYPSLGACAGEPVTLLVQGSPGNSYSWSSGGTGTQVVFSEDHFNLLGVGTHIFTVTVTQSGTGCTAVATPFTVDIHPVPPDFSISGTGSCAGSPTTISYPGSPPNNWQLIWNNGVSGAGLTTSDPGLYSLRIINEFGCATASDPWIILPGPNIGAVPAGCHTRCNPDTLCLPALPDVVGWQWFFNGSPIPGANQPGFVAQQSGSYYALLTDADGCTATSDPLNLNLYPGFGHIYGQVWSDVNGNGLVDPADTLVPGIPVDLWQTGLPWTGAVSGPAGDFAFTNIPSDSYSVRLDPGALPPDWQVIIGQVPASLSGCDVQASADLLIRYFVCPPLSTEIALDACEGGSAVYNGTTIPAGGSETFVFQNPDGCDSTVTVTVAILPVDYDMVNLAACPGETVFFNGAPILAGNTVVFTFQNAAGCDSLIEVAVGVYPVSPPTAVEAFICPGEVYFFNGNILNIGETADFLLANQWGCDSVVTVSVQAWPAAQSSLQAGVCPGETFGYDGQSWPVGTVQDFHFTNWQGCDSTVTLTVEALTPSEYELEASVCPGESYAYNGQSWPSGAIQIFVFDNWQGCDSVVTLQVHALATSSGLVEARVCPGDTYSFQGVSIPAGSSQDFILQNAAGCDSILTVDVTAFPVFTTPLDVVVCPGETYLFEGVELLPGETREFHLLTQEGCDSTVVVTVGSYPAVEFYLTPETACPNQPTGQLQATVAAGSSGPYRYALDAGPFGPDTVFSGLAAGAYAVRLEDANGCVFEATTVIDASAPLQVDLADGILPCDSGGLMLRPVVGGDTTGLSFQWSTGATSPALLVTEAGTVAVTVSNACETLQREASVAWADLADGLSLAYVPNSIAPGALEPQNAVFRPYFSPGLHVLEYVLEVYDRWGNLVFRTERPEDGWTGPFRDRAMDPAVFVWQFTARVGFCGRVMEVRRKGDVTVVR